MKKIDYMLYVRRSLITVIGVIIAGLGLAGFYASVLGSDPVSVWVEGIKVSLGVSYGTATFINTGTLMAIVLIFNRKMIGVGTVIILPTLSISIDFFTYLYDTIIPLENRSMIFRCANMIVAQVLFCIGLALWITAKNGSSGTESFVLTIAQWVGKPYRYVRMVMDAIFTLCGFLLGGIVNVGTVYSILTTGILVEKFVSVFRKKLGTFVDPDYIDEKMEEKENEQKSVSNSTR